MSYSPREYALCVFLTLQKCSDKEHPLDVSTIRNEMVRIFGVRSDNGNEIDRTTVSRILLSMEGMGSALPIHIVMNKGTAANPCFVKFEENDNKKSNKRYYYYEQPLSEGEILTVRDSIEAYNNLATEDITGIISRLIKLAPETYNIEGYASGNQDKEIKDPNHVSPVLYHISLLSDIIKAGDYANITYCNYGIDGKLQVRNGYPKLFKPIKLLWGNGYYYCACKKDDLPTPVSLRIDRMKSIKTVEKKSVNKQTASLYKVPRDLIPSKSIYRLQHPVMFGGKVLHVSMLVRKSDKNGMINALVDTFGRNITMKPATESDLSQAFKKTPAMNVYPDEKWITARVEGALGGIALFALQYCDNIRVISPKEVVEEVKRRIAVGTDLYS